MHRLSVCLAVLFVLLLVFIFAPSNNCTEGVNVGTVVTLHYTNWCSYCKQMKPIWGTVKANIGLMGKSIMFNEIDEDKAHTPGITSYPTILLLDPTGRRYKYPGAQDVTTLQNWILAPVH